MMPRTSIRAAVAATMLTLALTACDNGDAGPTGPELISLSKSSSLVANLSPDPEVSAWLASLREATAPFQRIEVARETGWDTPITDCMEMPGVGGMGYHYGNVGLIDGTAEDLAPEILLYEPDRNGRMRLVGVEYVVPFSFVPADATPPSLHGVEFHQNFVFGLWALHAWIWKHNGTGTFSDWNPSVTCAFAN